MAFADDFLNGVTGAGPSGTRTSSGESSRPAVREQLFDVVVADPPNFCPSPEHRRVALAKYTKLAKFCSLAAKRYLVLTCSSAHISQEDFGKAVATGLQFAGKRTARIVYQSTCQDLDHPVSPHVYNARYLKAVIVGL